MEWCSRDSVWVGEAVGGKGSRRSWSHTDRVCSLTLFLGSLALCMTVYQHEKDFLTIVYKNVCTHDFYVHLCDSVLPLP